MQLKHFHCLPIVLCTLTGCASMGLGGFTYKDLPVSKGSAATGSGNTVAFKGTPMKLEGTPLKVGEPIRDAKLATVDLKLVSLTDGKGRVRIVSIVPSLDTKVCEQQTHYLSEKSGELEHDVQLITVSVDTPFAQKRFAKEAKTPNVTFLSDYRGGDFGKAHGLLIPDLHLLARTVLVVDKDNVVRYMQVVPELGTMPDMDAAFAAARKIAGLPPPLPPMSSTGSMGWSY
ncbi:MAG TPA: thiol peroxidase [Nitrospirales bacterium]|nr:thiol peroxidase [Nitrospirales bacterium]